MKRLLINICAIVCLFAFPVFAASYGYGLILIMYQVSLPLFMIIGASHVVVALGIALLIDSRSTAQTMQAPHQ